MNTTLVTVDGRTVHEIRVTDNGRAAYVFTPSSEKLTRLLTPYFMAAHDDEIHAYLKSHGIPEFVDYLLINVPSEYPEIKDVHDGKMVIALRHNNRRCFLHPGIHGDIFRLFNPS